MEFSQINGVHADSVVINPAPTNSVMMSRSTLDFSGADAFRIDSSRLEPKKTYTPVIKTVPYVPSNDTIDHPAYDVLTGEFVITHDGSITSQLKINPIAPIDGYNSVQQAAIEAATPTFTPALPIADGTSKTILVQASGEPATTDTVVVVAADADTAVVSFADADSVGIAGADTTITDDSLTVRPAQKVFSEKEGKPITRPTNKILLDKNVGDTDWMVGIIILSCVLFAWSRMIYGKYISMLMQSAVNFFAARRVYEETNVVRIKVFALLNILFFINMGVFATQASNLLHIDFFGLTGFTQFIVWCGAFFAFYLIRTIILKLLDFIFDTHKFGAYNFNIYVYNKVYGLLLLPFIAAIPFVPGHISEKLVWAGLLLFALFYAFTLLRGLRICIKNRVSIFYLFFYLCALEILPLLTIYKYISSM